MLTVSQKPSRLYQPGRIAAERARLRLEKLQNPITWPTEYRNSDTGKPYQPHTADEAIFVSDFGQRYGLAKGGEGAGKSTLGILKVLGRLARGMSGIMVSPNLPHLKKSLWREFRLWCPANVLIPKHQYRLRQEWEPQEAFELVFINGASLIVGGIEKSSSWEGPNVNFAHIDEGRHAEASALKVLDGRCRIAGPNGESPQLWITTTPKKNWLFEYFGPVQIDDPYLAFKQNSLVITLPVELNRPNLAPGYIEDRRNSLLESEARILMDAEWEDEADSEKFVNLIWWDNCHEILSGLTRSEPCVIALDAAKGSETSLADTFAVVMVSRHPSRHHDIAIRYCGIWQSPAGKLLDFEPIENEVIRLCQEYSVIEMAYDPYQLHDMATRLKRKGIVNAQEFSQQSPRLIADKQLQQLIMGRRIAHDGNPLLRQHIDNADCKKSEGDTLRIVKRAQSLKVDAAVALSMAAARALYYNI